MKLLVVSLLISFVALASAVIPYEMDDNYDPVIYELIEIDDGKYRWGLRELQIGDYGCWYVRFKVKSWSTVFIQLSVSDGDGGKEYYEVMIGAWDNNALCVQRSNGDWLLDIKYPNILNGDWQYFYISQSYGRWSIGFQSDHTELASFFDDNVYNIKYVGIKSLEWSHWSFYWPGFGRNIIKTDIHDPGKYQWHFPELPHEDFYFEFAVKAGRDASIVFSPYNYYHDDIYEFIVGAEDNFFTCVRRRKGEKPVIDVITLDICNKDEYRYFWVRYDAKGWLAIGRYGEDFPIAEYYDDAPLKIRYFGVTSYECKSWWKFYTECPDPQYVCEHEKFHLHCDYGLVYVDYALYGRQNLYYCYDGYANDVDCGDEEKSLQRIRDYCKGKYDCVIDAHNDFFDDPCVGQLKYLRIDYHCCVCN